MGNDECKPVSVSRRIEAPAADIFELLADPDRHPEFDGSEMLRPGASNRVIVGIGDVFVTKMYFAAMGDYEMHNRIVVFEPDRCIAWEPGNPGECRTRQKRVTLEVRPRSRWPGCHSGDRNLRLHGLPRRGPRGRGQRQCLAHWHEQDTGATRQAVRDAIGRVRSPLTLPSRCFAHVPYHPTYPAYWATPDCALVRRQVMR